MRDDHRIALGTPPPEYDFRFYNELVNKIELYLARMQAVGPIRISEIIGDFTIAGQINGNLNVDGQISATDVSATNGSFTDIFADNATITNQVSATTGAFTDLFSDTWTPTGMGPGIGLYDGAGNWSGIAYETDVFDPTVRLSSMGDLSVAYNERNGWVTRIGNLIHVEIEISFTPTYSTGSGVWLFDLTGLPPAAFPNGVAGSIAQISGFTWPANTVMVGVGLNSAGDAIVLRGLRDQGSQGILFDEAHLPSGTTAAMFISLQYHTA